MLSRMKEFVEKHKYKIIAGAGVLAFGCVLFDYLIDESEIKMSTFMEALKMDCIDEVVVKGNLVEFRLSDSEWYKTLIGRFPIDQLYTLMREKNVVFSIDETLLSKEIINIGVGSVLSMATLHFMMQEMRKPQISNSNIQSQVVSNNQTFEDYYGGEAIKVKLKEIIDFLSQPAKYEKMGARIRRGVLFYGPPGTGKTMLARALANEAGCEFIKVVASEFQEMFVGVGAKRVRQLFATARASHKGCIIFVDEIDALGSRLNHLRDSHETTSTINQFLSEMDGFSSLDKVVIVAATNRIDLVDYAILRAGRFDIKVHIPLPNAEERKGIFKKLLATKCKKFEISDKSVDEIGNNSEGWCGADLQNLINQSIYKAIREKSEVLRENHLMWALKELHPQ